MLIVHVTAITYRFIEKKVFLGRERFVNLQAKKDYGTD